MSNIAKKFKVQCLKKVPFSYTVIIIHIHCLFCVIQCHLSVTQLSTQCGFLTISHPHGPPRPVIGIALAVWLITIAFLMELLSIGYFGCNRYKNKGEECRPLGSYAVWVL
jgi:hypothetical protein